MTDDAKNTPRETLLEFPCEFPIKMMGRDQPRFHEAVRSIIERHAGDVGEEAWRSTPSSKANFVSITVTINATSQAQLDSIYEELSAHEEILVAL